MAIEAFTREVIPACCGKSQIVYTLSFPIRKEHVASFEAVGFYVSKVFLNAGMCYIENNMMVIQGPFGSNRLTLKCKIKKCETMTSVFEDVITALYGVVTAKL